jgi:hypothetical protein
MSEPAKKYGSETRQRTESVRIRLTPAERRQAEEDAARAGLALGSYVRAKLFTGEPIRAVRSPSVDRKALAQFLAWLGRLNGNVYQISRAANFREWFEADALTKALKEITELRNAVLAALGHEPV